VRTSLRISLLVIAAVVVGAAGAPSRASGPAAFRIIVNPANGASAVDRRFLLEVFLKKTTRWPDGAAVRPVDQNADSPTRQRFSDEILGRSVSAVKSYWQQALFAGRDLPPPELDGDDDVVKFVQRFAGAIGYVSASANVNVDRVKVLTIK
jgi:ABC-type phosphate transport system substrate-binding protein